jgi:Lon protease-like protein
MNTITLPLFPLQTVLFPDGYLPLQIFEVRYLNMIKRAIADNTDFGIVTLTAGTETRLPERTEIFNPVGTLARIGESSQPMAGLIQIQCRGAQRFRIESSACRKDGLWMAEVSLLEKDRTVPIPGELKNVADALGKLIRSLQIDQVEPLEMPMQPPYLLDDCGWVANRWAELITLETEQRIRLLQLDNPVLRLELVQDLLDEAGWLLPTPS